MNSIKIFAGMLLSTTCLFSCGVHSSSQQKQADTATQLAIDTSKIKKDLNDIAGAGTGQLPDTSKLKAAGSDVLSTTAAVLSDTGISKLGDSGDPHVKAAQDAFKKMRNSMGITPEALDSMKKAAAKLEQGAQTH